MIKHNGGLKSMAKKIYTIPVSFSGTIEYDIEAASEKEAMEKAFDLAVDEDNFNRLENIDINVNPANEVTTI